MDDVDKAVESLKYQIKKEIVDNYFADRVYLEEDLELLDQEVKEYVKDLEILKQGFMALYQALGSQQACTLMMEILKIKSWPFYSDYCNLTKPDQLKLLKNIRPRGLTVYRRFRNLIYDLYERMQQENDKLSLAYAKIQTHLRLLNEDIKKFNLSYDFGLIAAQIEAMDGGKEESMSGGLLAPEREELSTRMRFKRRTLTDEQLPPVPKLPPLKEIKDEIDNLIRRIRTAPDRSS